MKIHPLEKNYPGVKHLLQYEMHKYKLNQNVIKAAIKHGQYTKEKFIEVLTYGSGPTVMMQDLDCEWAHYLGGKQELSQYITLNSRVAVLLRRNQKTDLVLREIIERILLHELMHYGDKWKDGVTTTTTEVGDNFDREVWGVAYNNRAADHLKKIGYKEDPACASLNTLRRMGY